MIAPIHVLAEGPGYLLALWRNLYMIDFRSTPTVEGLRATVKAKQTAIKQSPAGLAVLNFLAPGPLPSAEVRAVADEVQHADVGGTLCHATVVEATGFAGSAMRSVLTGMQTFGKSAGYPRKVFGDIDEALAWQAKEAKTSAEWLMGARAAVEDLRRRR